MSLMTLAALDLPLHLLQSPVLGQTFGGGGLTQNLVFIGLIFGIMYFVLIRPQQKQARETASMISSLKKGDEVVTSGGLLGRIFSVDEKVVTLEVSGGVKLRILKASVQGKVTVESPPKAETLDVKKEEK